MGGVGARATTKGSARNRFARRLLDGFAGPGGDYFGTRSGKLYGSRDEGKSWKKILGGLPQIMCVETAVIQMDESPAARPHLQAKHPAKRKTRRTKGVVH